MRLVFVGDIGIDSSVDVDLSGLPQFDESDLVVANLEGAILTGDRAALRRRRHVAVHNDPAVLDVLRATGVGAVGLANNHVFDFETPIEGTVEALEAAGIGSFGAGRDRSTAAAPLVVRHRGTTVKLFGFGWELIGCRAATAGRDGVNPLRPASVLDQARRARQADPDAFIVFQMHWNYELELYPQPAHRQLAYDLIRAGVDAVIGGHPHVAEGVELVDGKPVCYSLGNWLFPHRDLDGFSVAYPAVSRRQLAVELDVEGREVRQVWLHWHDFDPATVRIQPEAVEAVRVHGHPGGSAAAIEDGRGEESVEPAQAEGVDTPITDALTPYAGLSHAEYVDWFRTHRTRSRGLPIYADYQAATNVGRDAYLRLRQGGGEVLARLGLKREQRSTRDESRREDGGDA